MDYFWVLVLFEDLVLVLCDPSIICSCSSSGDLEFRLIWLIHFLGFTSLKFLARFGIWVIVFSCVCVLSMGALDEGHFNEELENGVPFGCHEIGFEGEPETMAIEDAVKVLLQGLGEDVNREGLRKTPLRVAKALREGTKGS